jgi:hypothetical protein
MCLHPHTLRSICSFDDSVFALCRRTYAGNGFVCCICICACMSGSGLLSRICIYQELRVSRDRCFFIRDAKEFLDAEMDGAMQNFVL